MVISILKTILYWKIWSSFIFLKSKRYFSKSRN